MGKMACFDHVCYDMNDMENTMFDRYISSIGKVILWIVNMYFNLINFVKRKKKLYQNWHQMGSDQKLFKSFKADL